MNDGGMRTQTPKEPLRVYLEAAPPDLGSTPHMHAAQRKHPAAAATCNHVCPIREGPTFWFFLLHITFCECVIIKP